MLAYCTTQMQDKCEHKKKQDTQYAKGKFKPWGSILSEAECFHSSCWEKIPTVRKWQVDDLMLSTANRETCVPQPSRTQTQSSQLSHPESAELPHTGWQGRCPVPAICSTATSSLAEITSQPHWNVCGLELSGQVLGAITLRVIAVSAPALGLLNRAKGAPKRAEN